jgi:hypothetical protein
VLVVGPSRGGKTTFLRETHARADGYSMFLTTTSNERKAQSDPPRRIRESSCEYQTDLQTARGWGKDVNEDTTILVDECQNAPTFKDKERGTLYHGLKEDAKYGIKWVISTQNPRTLKGPDGYDTVQNADYWVFVGPAKDWDVSFFNANNMSGLVEYLPSENYEYVVINPIASVPNDEKIVARGTTDPNFG